MHDTAWTSKAWIHEMLHSHGPRAVLSLEQGLTFLFKTISVFLQTFVYFTVFCHLIRQVCVAHSISDILISEYCIVPPELNGQILHKLHSLVFVPPNRTKQLMIDYSWGYTVVPGYELAVRVRTERVCTTITRHTKCVRLTAIYHLSVTRSFVYCNFMGSFCCSNHRCRDENKKKTWKKIIKKRL